MFKRVAALALYSVKRSSTYTMPGPKRVAIIGGGSSGLVTAKTLLHDFPDGTFEPYLFEAKTGVGGMWNVSNDTTTEDFFSTEMPTNISRYACSFSDLAWESVDLGQHENGQREPLPIFPKARHVKRYLETYAERYIPRHYIYTGCKVTRVVQTQSEDNLKFEVKWESSGTIKQAAFAYLVIASGFFAQAKTLGLPGMDHIASMGRVKHSSKLRNLEDDLVSGQNGKIVVVGGSMSGVEAAAAVAFQLSNAKHSPGVHKDLSGYSVHHLTSRPFWVLPPYVLRPLPPTCEENAKRAFLPWELVSNDLGRRGEEVVTYHASSEVTDAAARRTNGRLSVMVGSKQASLAGGLLSFEGDDGESRTPWVTISSSYSQFVHSGDITVHLGSLESVTATEIKMSDGSTLELTEVALLVLATGFAPHSSLAILPDDILQSLGYRPGDDYAPLALDKFAMTNPAQPRIGFVGFYRGPYFGVSEMQARWLGKKWCRQWSGGVSDVANGSSAQESHQANAAATAKLPRGQFPMADYVGLMESLSREVSIDRSPIPGLLTKQGPVIAARYSSKSIGKVEKQEIEKTLSSLAAQLSVGVEPNVDMRFLGPAVFRALQGQWKLIRQLISVFPGYPSGTFHGTATFYPRLPTDSAYSTEMLFVEEGELTTQQGLKMTGRRRYVYRLEEGGPITCWFVKSDGVSVDYLFHTLAFQVDDKRGWKAVGSPHLCIDDNYASDYRFVFEGIELKEWRLEYEVRGPKKDYQAKSTLSRS